METVRGGKGGREGREYSKMKENITEKGLITCTKARILGHF